jgi:hypothetical protein
MGLRKGILQAGVVVALGVFASTSALAQSVTTRVVTAGGSATSTAIQPGGSASIDVRLDTTNAALIGTGFTLSETTPACSGFLSITGRSFTGSPFNDTSSGTPDATVLAAPSNLLDPANNDNLGRTTVNLVGISPSTQSNVLAANLTLTSSASTPLGTCMIVPTSGVSFATDDAFNDYDMSTADAVHDHHRPAAERHQEWHRFGDGFRGLGSDQLRRNVLGYLSRHDGHVDGDAHGWLYL